MPSSRGHQVGKTPTRSHQGNDEDGPASTTTLVTDKIKTDKKTKKHGNGHIFPSPPLPPSPSNPVAIKLVQHRCDGCIVHASFFLPADKDGW